MITKDFQSVREFFGGLPKAKPALISALTNLVNSISQDEEIIDGFSSTFLYHNRGQESVVSVFSLVTNKKYYYCGTDGVSVFIPQYKAGNVLLKDIHALTSGTTMLQGSYVQFETKNEDYKIQGPNLDTAKIQSLFETAIAKARTEETAVTVIQATTSPADELKKFKELLDMDAITQEEFNAKKKQILGL